MVSLFFCGILTVTYGYGSINKSVSLYSVRAIMEKSVPAFIFIENKTGTVRKENDMGKMTDNCTDIKAAITVKAVFDGTQSGQQAFMQLIRRQYRINGEDKETRGVDILKYNIDKTQYKGYTKDSEADVGGTTVDFAENGGRHDGF